MVKVKLHIVGFSNTYHDVEEEYDDITLKDIYMYLIKKNILLTKLTKYCRFIHNLDCHQSCVGACHQY